MRPRAYDPAPARPARVDLMVGAIAAAAVLGVLTRSWWPAACVAPAALALAALGGRDLARVACGAALVAAVGGWRGGEAWERVTDARPGPFSGWARLADDPVPVGRGTSVAMQVEGRRYAVLAFGSPGRRLASRLAGEWVSIEGVRVAAELPTWQRTRHLVGRMQVDVVRDHWEGGPPSRAANRVRRALRTVTAAHLPEVETEVFLGLVIGDDARQPSDLRQAFRDAGLSHLSAVSGQNVAYLIAAASLLVRWLRPWARWAATLLVVGWFVVLTRAEPSVVRAATMAALVLTARWRGHQTRPARVVAAATGFLVLVDPLLAWSVGFWLSVSATIGVGVVAPWLAARWPGPAWIRLPLAVTVAAQAAVAVPSLLVFGRLPLVSVPANLLAVPVAGAVMLLGLPAALFAWLVPPLGGVVLAPVGWATSWVVAVARTGAAVDPGTSPITLAAWLVLLVALLGAARHGVRH